MKQTITKMKRVEETVFICDICGKQVDYSYICDVCKKDTCYEHSCTHAGDILPVMWAGNYRCCLECDKKLEPWRTKLRILQSEYESKRKNIIKDFLKEFGLNDEQ